MKDVCQVSGKDSSATCVVGASRYGARVGGFVNLTFYKFLQCPKGLFLAVDSS